MLVAGRRGAALPMPMIQIFGGGAHAGRRVDIQDFLIVPVGAASFDEALAMAARVYRAAGEIMAARGRLHGVADEGGWWPEFASQWEALDTLVDAIERAGLAAGDEIGIALDVAASQFHRGGRYRLAADGVELDTYGTGRVVARLVPSAIRSSRSRTRWPRTTTRAWCRSPPRSASGCRSSATTIW